MSAENGRSLGVDTNQVPVDHKAGVEKGGVNTVTNLVEGQVTPVVPTVDKAWEIRQTIVRAMQMNPTAVKEYEQGYPIHFKS